MSALAGRTAVVNLWASWCGRCREEMPVLAAYARQPDAVPVIGINVRDDPAYAIDLVVALHVPYPSFIDENEVVRRALRLPPVLPISLLVHPDGSVSRITQPLVFASTEQVREAITRGG